jgi:hypothetical protein
MPWTAHRALHEAGHWAGEEGDDMRASLWQERLLAATGLLFLALFACGLLLADVVADAAFPAPSQPLGEVAAYFGHNPTAVRGLSLFHALASLALLVFAAYVATVLRRAEADRQGALGTVAVVGGAVAGAFLLLDASLFWVLALPSTAGDPALLRALHALSYLAGGVALAFPMVAFIGASSLVALSTGLLPGWLAWTGLVAAVAGLAYATTLVAERGAWSPSGAYVLAFPGLLWIVATSFVLVRRARPLSPTPAGEPT